MNIATKAGRGTGKRKGFCALISIDIRNAFNTARWNTCIEAIVREKVSDYLLQMIDDYLSDRWVTYEGDKWSLKEEMTCGAPQGSRVGPLVWNAMYEDFLRMDLPAGIMYLKSRYAIKIFIEACLICYVWNVSSDYRVLSSYLNTLDKSNFQKNRLVWRSRPVLRLVNQVCGGHWLTGASGGHRLFLLNILFQLC